MATDIDVYGGSATESAIDKLSAGKTTVFSTISGDDFDSKMAVLEATTASEPLAENLNKKIELANVVVQLIDMADEETGVVSAVPRTILVDKSGKAYHAISSGVFKSIENIFGIIGSDPSKWGGPVNVKAVRGGSGTRQYMTLVPAK